MKKSIGVLGLLAVGFMFACGTAINVWAGSAAQIDANVNATLDRFYDKILDGKKLAQSAKGVLVFPNVYKAGLGIGGEFGEGALRINGKTVDYYDTIAGSFGFQLGAEKKSMILLFMQDEALDRLRSSSNWKIGADASVTLIAIGADGSIDTQKLNQPILGFVLGQKGLMYNLTLEGTKITKVKKS